MEPRTKQEQKEDLMSEIEKIQPIIKEGADKIEPIIKKGIEDIKPVIE